MLMSVETFGLYALLAPVVHFVPKGLPALVEYVVTDKKNPDGTFYIPAIIISCRGFGEQDAADLFLRQVTDFVGCDIDSETNHRNRVGSSAWDVKITIGLAEFVGSPLYRNSEIHKTRNRR